MHVGVAGKEVLPAIMTPLLFLLAAEMRNFAFEG